MSILIPSNKKGIEDLKDENLKHRLSDEEFMAQSLMYQREIVFHLRILTGESLTNEDLSHEN